jgi:hypothetical protein
MQAALLPETVAMLLASDLTDIGRMAFPAANTNI